MCIRDRTLRGADSPGRSSPELCFPEHSCPERCTPEHRTRARLSELCSPELCRRSARPGEAPAEAAARKSQSAGATARTGNAG
eukprot:7486275-Alexandrium_andersonii.AAC.1